MKDGLKLAALYGIRPHQLGFCGHQGEKGVLLEYLQGKDISKQLVRKILKSFEAAYPYYKLIAKSNNIKDPLSRRVVEAYWVGNELLDRVKISDLRKMIIREFSKPGLLSDEIAVRKAELIPENSKPHHSFHVLVVGSITGNPMPKDLCRPCWGRIKRIMNHESGIRNKLLVEYQPLIGKKELRLGKPVKKEIDWDKSLVPNVKIGDWVSFHWNQAVEVLTKEDVKNLEKYTKITLASLNKI